jgi:hypothetical protein
VGTKKGLQMLSMRRTETENNAGRWYVTTCGKREHLSYRCSVCRLLMIFEPGAESRATVFCCGEHHPFKGDMAKLTREELSGYRYGNRNEQPWNDITLPI